MGQAGEGDDLCIRQSCHKHFLGNFYHSFRSSFLDAILHAIIIARADDAALVCLIHLMALIHQQLLPRQLAYIETFLGICQAWGCVALLYLARLQETNPLIEMCLRHLVEVVDAQEVILWEDVARLSLRLLILLEGICKSAAKIRFISRIRKENGE